MQEVWNCIRTFPKRCGKISALQEQRTKNPKNQKFLVLSTREQGRRVIAAPVIVEPVAAPTPPTVAPAEVTNKETTNGTAKDNGPEEYEAGIPIFILLPVFGYETRILQESIHDIRVEHGFSRKLFPKLMSLNYIPVLLAFGLMKNDLAAIDIQSVSALLNFYPAVADLKFNLRAIEGQLERCIEIDPNNGLTDDNEISTNYAYTI